MINSQRIILEYENCFSVKVPQFSRKFFIWRCLLRILSFLFSQRKHKILIYNDENHKMHILKRSFTSVKIEYMSEDCYFYKGSTGLIKFLYEIFMIPIRKAIIFIPKTLGSFQKPSYCRNDSFDMTHYRIQSCQHWPLTRDPRTRTDWSRTKRFGPVLGPDRTRTKNFWKI